MQKFYTVVVSSGSCLISNTQNPTANPDGNKKLDVKCVSVVMHYCNSTDYRLQITLSFPFTEVGSRHRPPPRRDLTIVRSHPALLLTNRGLHWKMELNMSKQTFFIDLTFMSLSHSTATWCKPTQAAHSSSGRGRVLHHSRLPDHYP